MIRAPCQKKKHRDLAEKSKLGFRLFPRRGEGAGAVRRIIMAAKKSPAPKLTLEMVKIITDTVIEAYQKERREAERQQ